MKQKRYLLFAGDDYYPQGGAWDLKGFYITPSDAIEAHNSNEHRYDGGWANILDTKTGDIIWHFNRGTWFPGADHEW